MTAALELVELRRRHVLGLLMGLALAPWWSRRASAEDPDLPVETQVKLLGKVVNYDRNAAARMAGTARVLILRRKGDSGSASVAAKLRTDLADLAELAGATIDAREHDFIDIATLTRTLTDQGTALLVLTPGLSPHVEAIADSLDGRDLLSVSTLARDVPSGIVLGFALESSHPTIWINLGRAKRQNVDFSSRLLALAKVVGQ